MEDIISIDVEHYKDLISNIIKKTNGNPLFIKEILLNSYEHGYITFKYLKALEQKSEKEFGWYIDPHGIQKMELSDTLVEIIAARIKRLPKETQDILVVASCIGVDFSVKLLADVLETSIDEISSKLTEPVKENMITVAGNVYKFIHDRIQEAAYTLISHGQRLATHYKIGKILQREYSGKWEEDTFAIVHQLNLASSLMEDQNERDILARLNLAAGIHAGSSNAYEASLDYFNEGIQLLDELCWEKNYDCAVSLFMESVKAASLTGDYETLEKFAHVGSQHSKSIKEKAKILIAKVDAYTAQGKFEQAIKTGIDALMLLGIHIPQKPNRFHIMLELIKSKWSFLNKDADKILNLPQMVDPRIILVVQILTRMASAVYYTNLNMFVLFGLRFGRLAIKYGLAPEHAYGFCRYWNYSNCI